MIITCEQCGISFKLDDSLIKPQGSKVRCSKCKSVFRAYPPAPEPEKVQPEPDFSLDDDDISAGLEEDPDLGLEEDAGDAPSDAPDDFQLSIDDDEDLGLEAEADDEGAEEDTLDDDLQLDFDEAGGDDDAVDEEDDFGLVLDDDEDVSADKSDTEEDDFELDFDDDDLGLDDDDLGLDQDPGSSEAFNKSPSPAGSGELELELDEEGAPEEDDLDFSEVDSLLEADDDASVADTVELSADELNLVLNEDIDGTEPIEQQEIDLADLEQTIEMELLEPEDEDEEREGREDVELALSDEDKGLDDDIDFSDADAEDFSDIEQMLASDEDDEEGALAADDEMDASNAVPLSAADKKKAKKAKKEKVKKPKKEKKAGAGEPGIGRRLLKVALAILLVLVLIAGLTVGAYFLASSMGVSVPSLDKLPVIGTLLAKGDGASIRTDVIVVKSTLQNKFATNAHAGKLLIITGTVMNRASTPRRFVKVTATLLSQANPLLREESVYCGNMLSFEELSEQDMAYIRRRLANRAGDNNQNTDIKAGATVPFMIVIPDLPPDLVGYEVMVAEASPVS